MRHKIFLWVIMCVFLIKPTSSTPKLNDRKHEQIIFTLEGIGDTYWLLPFVILDKNKYLRLSVDEMDKKTFEKFEDLHCPLGKEYSLSTEGKRVGSAIVIGPDCEVNLEITDKTRSGIHKGVVTTFNLPGATKFLTHRVTTGSEIIMMKKFGEDCFSQKGISRSLVRKTKIKNIYAIQTHEDAKPTLVGSFSLEETRGIHEAFIIAEAHGGNYDVALSVYHTSISPHPNRGDVYAEDFYDAIDLDNDGEAELITRLTWYEGRDYAIYKQISGKWQKVYQGGGGAH